MFLLSSDLPLSVSPFLCLSLLSVCLSVFLSMFLRFAWKCMCLYTMWWTNYRKIVTLEVSLIFLLLSVVHLSLKVGMMVTSMQLCSFTSLSMTMTLCVTSGVLKSVLFIHITFNDHNGGQILKVSLCVTSGVLKSVLFIHITFNDHDKCWRCYCVWHRACWKVYCSFTSLSMIMTGNKCWRCYCVWHRACWRVYLPESDISHWAAVWLNPSSRSVALWTDGPAVGYCACRINGPFCQDSRVVKGFTDLCTCMIWIYFCGPKFSVYGNKKKQKS